MKDRILVIQTAFPGDAILTLPMIQKLKDVNLQSDIDVVAIPMTAEIFESSPFIKDVLILDKKKKHKSLISIVKFANELRKRNYSKIISPHRSFRTALIILISGVRDTYGFDNASLKYVYKNIVNYKIDNHEIQRNLDLIGYNKINSDWKIKPLIRINEDVQIKIKNIIEGISNPKIIAVAPGSVWKTKRYPKEYYIGIINHLVNTGFEIFLIGGENDVDLCNEIYYKIGKSVTDLAGKLTIIESIQLLKNCKLLLCNDSAPTHMGMCAGIPVLTIYCSTIPDFGFYPFNESSSYLSYEQLSCKPCGIHGYTECPLDHFDCGFKLIPETVLSSINNMLH